MSEQNKLPIYISVSHVFTTLHVDFPALIAKNHAAGKHDVGDIHDFPELLYIRQGRHRVYLNGVPHDLTAGQLIIYAPNVYHCGDGSSTAIGEIISFDTASPEMHLYYNRVITLNREQKRMLLRIFSISRGLFSGAKPDSGLRWMIPCDKAEVRDLQKLKNLLELFFLELYQNLPKADLSSTAKINHMRYHQSEFDHICRYMQMHLHESLTLAQLSRDCSMSIDKVKRMFRRQCSCGPIAYFNTMKIDAAKKLIEETPLNFTQISEQLGFHSVGYFSRMFKAKAGMTPSEYAGTMKNLQ